MKTFIKCEVCDVEIPADTCPFATHRKVIGGKEYVYCCAIMQRKFMFDRTAIDPDDSKKGRKRAAPK